MLNKLIIVFISLVLTSCFFEKAKEPVVIIDKSIGQEPIDSNHLSIAKIVEKRKITIKSELIPVAGRIIKTFSKSHQGLSFATNSLRNKLF
jgi:lipoprotein NlpD